MNTVNDHTNDILRILRQSERLNAITREYLVNQLQDISHCETNDDKLMSIFTAIKDGIMNFDVFRLLVKSEV